MTFWISPRSNPARSPWKKTKSILRNLLNGVGELLGPRAHSKGIEIATAIDRDVPRVIRVDEVRFRQVLTNLIGNAVKFTEKGGICVAIKMFEGRDRDFLKVEVRDTGVGVPPQKRQEIFQEFVQADSTHARKFGGSGLGLAISKRLVETMGGEIGIEPGAENGSVFWFTLPALVVEPASLAEAPLAGKRIAIVTRNKTLREGLGIQIEQAGGEAINFSHLQPSGRIDAILIDAGTDSEPDPFVQPDPDVPALVLVTPAARVRLEALKAMGFAGYLVKPVRETSLIQRLEICMEAERPATPYRRHSEQQEASDTDFPSFAEEEELPPAFDAEPPHWSSAPPPFVTPPPVTPPLVTIEAPPPPYVRVEAPPPPKTTAAATPEASKVSPPRSNDLPPPAAAAAPATVQGGLKILLAEDNPVNALLIRELLRRRGHRITEVTTGTAAVEAMQKDNYDLLLTDIHMPGMDGIEAARTIRAMEQHNGRARTPIVALTADALETGKRACQEAGMDGFLTKPVDPAELEEMFLMLFPSEEGLPHTAAA